MPFSSRFKVMVVFSLLLVGVLSFGLLNFPRVPVHAANANITLSVHAGPPTSSLTVQGEGFGPGETVAITFDSASVGNTMADSMGSFSVQITVPASALPGSHIVQATGQSSGFSAQANFLVQTNWRMDGYNSRHTRFNPYENVLNVTNVSNLVQDWTATTGNSIYASPAVVNGIVYAGSSDTSMYAFDAKTGTIVWKAPGTWPIGASPAIADRIVYTGEDDGYLHAFNAKTGAVVWTALVGGFVESPTVSQGIVYVGSSMGNTKLYALDAKAGTVIWTANTSYITSTPAVANNIVYVSSSDDTLYAFNAKTGASIWTAQTGGPIWFSSSAVANGTVYIGSNDDKVYAFNATTGAQLWSGSTGNQIFSSPTVVNGVVYVGSEDGKLYAFHVPGTPS
jgi:outer membrane protein assembly factor BamB